MWLGSFLFNAVQLRMRSFGTVSCTAHDALTRFSLVVIYRIETNQNMILRLDGGVQTRRVNALIVSSSILQKADKDFTSAVLRKNAV